MFRCSRLLTYSANPRRVESSTSKSWTSYEQSHVLRNHPDTTSHRLSNQTSTSRHSLNTPNTHTQPPKWSSSKRFPTRISTPSSRAPRSRRKTTGTLTPVRPNPLLTPPCPPRNQTNKNFNAQSPTPATSAPMTTKNPSPTASPLSPTLSLPLTGKSFPPPPTQPTTGPPRASASAAKPSGSSAPARCCSASPGRWRSARSSRCRRWSARCACSRAPTRS
jgi:hypothetical protein